jgi:hypothetical protein
MGALARAVATTLRRDAAHRHYATDKNLEPFAIGPRLLISA